MSKIAILGAGESGAGAAVLAKKQGFEVFVSDMSKINDKYKKLMDAYEDNSLFSRLDRGGDALTDDHANASIPVSHGAGRLYEITTDDKWKKRMEAFWKTAVTDRGMFSTTGSNAGEFWIPNRSHSRFLCSTTQEFCTVYNMVRTAEYLYRWTGSGQQKKMGQPDP